MLYISHKLEEVKRLCDTATILRPAKRSPPAIRAGNRALARRDDGRRADQRRAGDRRRQRRVPRLVVDRLSAASPLAARRVAEERVADGARRRDGRHRRRRRQRPVRTVRPSVGRSLIADRPDAIVDRRPRGRATSASTSRRALGAAFVPEERHGHAAAPDFSLSENASLTGHAASGMSQRRLHRQPIAMLAKVDRSRSPLRRAQGQARPGSPQPVRRQSAEIRRRPRNPAQPGVLVVNQPTWGVDAGAAAIIRQALIDLAAPAPRCW